jgi:cell division protein FtsB
MKQLKIGSWLLIVLLIFLQYRLWFQKGGVVDMIHLRKEVALEKQQNEKLKKRNEILAEDVKRLKNNNEAVESRARHELGMVKKGETFYQVVK